MRKVLTIMALFVIGLLSLSFVSALDNTQLDFKSVEVNGDEIAVAINPVTGLLEFEHLSVEEGQALDIKVGLTAFGRTGANDIEVDAKISGYDKVSNDEDISDSTELFDLAAGTTKYVTLHVTVPRGVEKNDYTLRLRVLDRNSPAWELEIPLAFEPSRHGFDIADVSFSPSLNVKAGRSLLANVLLENFGDKNQRDVKVTVAIPALGVSSTEYVDVVNNDDNIDYEDVPEMFLSIPANAEAGDYQVVVTAQYDRLRRTVTKIFTAQVVADERQAAAVASADALVVAVWPETQNVAAGQTATYAVALTNAGTTSKAYSVEVVTGSWGTARVTENLVVLEPGKNKVTYVEITPVADAVAGQHVASLVIKSGSDVLQTISLNANVVQKAVDSTNVTSLRNGLEIALIVLVVLLVIIGLIIGFSRLKKDDEEDKTYY